MLGAGLLALAGVGGAAGYGAGLFLTDDPSLAGSAAPLPLGSATPTPPASPTPPPVKIVPDRTKALDADDLEYKLRSFDVTGALRSAVRVRVPTNWTFTQPDPPTVGRFNEPTGKRWIRIEAGFTIRRPPSESMAARIQALAGVPADQALTIISDTVDPQTHDANLAYTFVSDNKLRYVIIRWVANREGLCMFEIAVTGLPQDRAALADVLDHASESAVREDSTI
jgi:hypothetical protein